MRTRTYKYVGRLVHRITRKAQPLNDAFRYYGRNIVLQSGMKEFVVVTVKEIDDRHFGDTLEFDYDFMTHKLFFNSTQCRKMTERVIDGFKEIYGQDNIKVGYHSTEYKDETTQQPTLPI